MSICTFNSKPKRLLVISCSMLLTHITCIFILSLVVYTLDHSRTISNFFEIVQILTRTTLGFGLVATMATYGVILLLGELQGFLYIFYGKKWMYFLSLFLIIGRYIMLYLPMYLGAFNHI